MNTEVKSEEKKRVLVTGGNSGIGFALCRLLVSKYGCHVYLGSRNSDRGKAAISSIIEEFPEEKENIELATVDVSDDTSVDSLVSGLRERGLKESFYAVVNNAGVGLAHGDVGGVKGILNVNYYGVKRVTDAVLKYGLMQPQGRIVNVSSGAASMWLRNQDETSKKLFTSPDTTFEELDEAVQKHAKNADSFRMGGYGLSKAACSELTIIHAKANPTLKIVSLSPGFIATNMTKGFGAKLTPEQGCVSSIKCLFDATVVSGCYYGSDGLRSPMTCTRDPGMPEYQGEPNPDPKKYNK